MNIVLDTNFLVTCAKENLDFVTITEELTDEHITWIVPQPVLNELGNLKDNKHTTKKDKAAATISFKILASLKPQIVELEKNQNVDVAIINYISNTKYVLATLDKKLKERVPNNTILTFKGKNYLQFI